MKQRWQCYNKVKWGIKTGELIKPEYCSRCGKGGLRLNAHHEDYNKPLDVEWLCYRCHIVGKHSDRKRRTVNRIGEAQQTITIKGKNERLPQLKDEPSQLKGIFLEEDIEDNHQKRTEGIEWPILLAELPKREREIIKLRYGFGKDSCTYTLEEVGRVYRVSRERVRQVEKRAIRKLRERIT